MIKILQVCVSLKKGGGVQEIIKNYYSCMDKSKFQFDFIVYGESVGELEEWFSVYNSHIYHVVPRSKNFLKNIIQIAKIIKKGNYDIIHCHQDYHSAIAIALAKHYHVRKRIVHSHRAYPKESRINKYIRIIETRWLSSSATEFCACSELSAKWMYGESNIDNIKIIHNAFEIQNYSFSEEKRENIREKFSLTGKVVIGHVGRFTPEKNHELLLKIFAQLHRTNDKTVLMLVGDGEMKNAILSMINKLNIRNDVLLLGTCNDVGTILNAMDVFVFTSLNEGLGMAVIEAQANNLPVVCSPFVPQEVKLSDRLYFQDKSDYENIGSWVDIIEMAIKNGRSQKIDLQDYNIKNEVEKFVKLYS